MCNNFENTPIIWWYFSLVVSFLLILFLQKIKNIMSKIMDRFKKLFNNLKISENKTTIYDLSNDCLKEVIKKLSINEIFKIERVDKRFQFCVKEVLKQQKVLSFGVKMFPKHWTNSSQLINFGTDIDCNQIKVILKKCQNIKCLQMKGILINKSLIEWISDNCKQLVCIHLFRPKSDSKTPRIEFKDIGSLLSDKIEVEINFGLNDMNRDSITALILNMPQIKDITFWDHMRCVSIQELIPYFGQNTRSLSITVNNDLTINDLNALKNNTNLVELNLYSCVHSQQKFDLICDNLTQLKSFNFYSNQFISISKLIKLNNLEYLELIIDEMDVELFAIDKNNLSNKCLKSLKVSSKSIMTSSLFEGLVQMCPNIEKLSINYWNIFCEHQNTYKKYLCYECFDKVFKCLSKLNRLKVLQIIPFSCETLKAIESNINEHTFKQLVELKLYNYCNEQKVNNKSKQIFLNFIQSLTQMCDRNTKQLFTLKINENYMNLIIDKKLINGIEYNVFFDCGKFQKNLGIKFEIPKNMRIIQYFDD